MDTEGRPPLLAGRYRLVEQLGRGGMGVVWRAVDEVLDREVAVKEVRAPENLGDGEVRVLYARLKQEARAAARISHPNVITVHDVVEQHGRPWIVMELVRGRSLADVLLEEGVLESKEAARVGALVLQGLRAAHAVGVLHRDVKPANVLMGPGGQVILTDFGIALIEGASTLTRTGDLIGSPEYLAPERAMGQRPGIPSDLWSLGTTLYAAVEGISPFRRGTALNTLRAVVDDEPPPPRRAGPLTPLLEGLMRKDPQARMGSAEAERLLEAVASGRLTHTPGYVPTVAAGPGPSTPPAPVPTPVPSPMPSPVPVPVPASPPTPPRQFAPAPSVPSAPPPDPDARRRTVVRIVGAVLALLLVGGGTAAGVALLHGGGSSTGTNTPGSSTATPQAQQTGGGTAGATGDGGSTGNTGNTGEETTGPPTSGPTDYATTPVPGTGTGGTCGGGWVTSC